MRRRTTSHKPRRMSTALKNAKREARTGTGAKDPLYQRGGKGDELRLAGSKDGSDDKARCRKHRRRPRALLAARSPHAEGLPEEGLPARYGTVLYAGHGMTNGMKHYEVLVRYAVVWYVVRYNTILYYVE